MTDYQAVQTKAREIVTLTEEIEDVNRRLDQAIKDMASLVGSVETLPEEDDPEEEEDDDPDPVTVCDMRGQSSMEAKIELIKKQEVAIMEPRVAMNLDDPELSAAYKEVKEKEGRAPCNRARYKGLPLFVQDLFTPYDEIERSEEKIIFVDRQEGVYP